MSEDPTNYECDNLLELRQEINDAVEEIRAQLVKIEITMKELIFYA